MALFLVVTHSGMYVYLPSYLHIMLKAAAFTETWTLICVFTSQHSRKTEGWVRALWILCVFPPCRKLLSVYQSRLIKHRNIQAESVCVCVCARVREMQDNIMKQMKVWKKMRRVLLWWLRVLVKRVSTLNHEAEYQTDDESAYTCAHTCYTHLGVFSNALLPST